MAPRHSRNARRKHRIVSISMAPDDAAWVDTLVDLLVDGGYSKAGRSEVVRLALLELRVILRERGRSEVVRYFVQRDAERQVASLLDRVEEAVAANDDKEPGDAT
jgi:Arc/MetJ-type ribon-helix-helix transcriptional regulator